MEYPAWKHIHLVLYSDTDEHYRSMYALTRKYYSRFEDMKTLYYMFSDTISKDYELREDILLIRGSETYIPGVLDKTIKALQYVQKHMTCSGYVIRSNISTIVDFTKLFSQPLHQFDYGGPSLILNWKSPRDGIHDGSLAGLQYISGTCIMMSARFVLDLVAGHSARLDTSLIDDVALGVYFKRHCPGMVLHSFGNALDEEDPHFKIITTAKSELQLRGFVNGAENILFYRNRNEDRSVDVDQMAILLDALGC